MFNSLDDEIRRDDQATSTPREHCQGSDKRGAAEAGNAARHIAC